jgi:hypothetical protein
MLSINGLRVSLGCRDREDSRLHHSEHAPASADVAKSHLCMKGNDMITVARGTGLAGTQFAHTLPQSSAGKPIETQLARRRVPFIFLAAVFLGALDLSATARAEVVSPDTGLSAKLGDVSVSVYYLPIDVGYQVVITAGTDDPHSIVRFVCTLAPGQDAIVSVPRAVGQPRSCSPPSG